MPHAHTFDIELRFIPNWLFILDCQVMSSCTITAFRLDRWSHRHSILTA